ncbi:hypothetical protein ACFXPY_40555 [Streptomyces sp. NPDC059153]|uniref:hypothetical protein n=1 Tax=Streptomyces sp. NPDC059153 TaxID=3346743 RepID=UPI0036D01FFD
MTAQGLAAIEAAAPQHVETARRYFFAPLSPDEVETLGVPFDRLLASLSRDTDRPFLPPPPHIADHGAVPARAAQRRTGSRRRQTLRNPAA